MGLFTKSAPAKTSPNSSAMTIIAQGTTFQGDMHLEGKLHIDGKVEGNIHCENAVTVGKTGVVKGAILSRSVIVSGHIEGDVDCSSLNIDNGGTVDGRVCSEQMTIAPKGNFIGERRKRIEEGIAGELVDDRDFDDDFEASKGPTISAAADDDEDDEREPKVSMAAS